MLDDVLPWIEPADYDELQKLIPWMAPTHEAWAHQHWSRMIERRNRGSEVRCITVTREGFMGWWTDRGKPRLREQLLSAYAIDMAGGDPVLQSGDDSLAWD